MDTLIMNSFGSEGKCRGVFKTDIDQLPFVELQILSFNTTWIQQFTISKLYTCSTHFGKRTFIKFSEPVAQDFHKHLSCNMGVSIINEDDDLLSFDSSYKCSLSDIEEFMLLTPFIIS